jgi:hypothetical protein
MALAAVSAKASAFPPGGQQSGNAAPIPFAASCRCYASLVQLERDGRRQDEALSL